ncbi:MAG: leucine-rich repeat protein [Bacteroidales bacterium]|nr:leucine-rich repeat protein [Bacteroidales bacterium]
MAESNIKNSNIWLGSESYKISDANRFKGRADDIEKFLNIIRRSSMSVLYAESGIGKTSFLRAGISSRIQYDRFIPIEINFTDEVFGDNPKQTFEQFIISRIKEKLEEDGKDLYYYDDKIIENSQNEKLKANEESLWWLLHTKRIAYKPETDDKKEEPSFTGESLFLIFDQFEEVFDKTTNNNVVDYNKLKTIFGLVQELSSQILPKKIEENLIELEKQDIYIQIDTPPTYKTVFSFRKEYLSDFDYWTNDVFSVTEFLQNRMLLKPMTYEQAKEVITEQPNEKNTGIFKSEVTENADEILKFLSQRNKDENKLSETQKKQEEIEPLILSIVCQRLQNNINEGQKFSLDGIIINTIIRDFYESLINDSPESLVEPKYISDFEDSLVYDNKGKGGRRRRRANDIDPKNKWFKKSEEDLKNNHLIRIEKYNGDDYVEIIHDRIADVIYQRQTERKQKKQRNKRIIIVVAIVILLLTSVIRLSINNGYKNGVDNLTYLTDKVLINPFADCSYSTSVKKIKYDRIENGLIGGNFSYCENLQEVEIDLGDTVSNICLDLNFSGCGSLEKINIKNNQPITSVWSFKNCTNLESFDLSHISKIADSTFYRCNKFKNIDISTADAIGRGAFADCKNLKTVKLSSDTNLVISSDAFDNCYIDTFDVNGNSRYLYKEGFLVDLKEKELIYFKPDTNSKGSGLYFNGKKYGGSYCYLKIPDEVKKNIVKTKYSVRDSANFNGKTYNLSYYYSFEYNDTTYYLADISYKPTQKKEEAEEDNTEYWLRNDTLFAKSTVSYIRGLLRYLDKKNKNKIKVIDVSKCNNGTLYHYKEGLWEDFSILEEFVLPDTLKYFDIEFLKGIKHPLKVRLPKKVDECKSYLDLTQDKIKFIIPNSSDFRIERDHYLIYKDTLVACFNFDENYKVHNLKSNYLKKNNYESYKGILLRNYGDTVMHIEHIPHTLITQDKVEFPKNYRLDLQNEFYQYLDTLERNSIDWFQLKRVYKYKGFIYAYIGKGVPKDKYTVLIPGNIFDYKNLGKKILYIPALVRNHYSWSIEFNTDSIEEIHIPYTQPLTEKGEQWICSNKNISHIVLYVPKGCKQKYLSTGKYSAFKDIREDSRLRGYINIVEYYSNWLWKGFKYNFLEPVNYYGILFLLCILFSVSTIFGGKKERKEKLSDLKDNKQKRWKFVKFWIKNMLIYIGIVSSSIIIGLIFYFLFYSAHIGWSFIGSKGFNNKVIVLCVGILSYLFIYLCKKFIDGTFNFSKIKKLFKKH